ncbi:glutamate racemase [Oribacterium sp. WCC10]|uniref:glutamate racemase n=1 Tax=Oribacterium sp. WCC10 TaxID=1855343 RepID=UPI0008E8FC19|nr:glutamate racemase [Oribacterium sp. WCC10]SFG29332.1 glutamate racemase [Oribacterium sp. WCC10]
MISKNSPIGVFDSGVGGISVLRILRHDMPNENFVFFGDSINAPYGEKSDERIKEMCDDNIRFLFKKDAKAIVIACNTATSAAATFLREKYPDTIIVAMEPAVKPAVDKSESEHPKVLVLATKSTIHGERLHHLIGRFSENADIYPVAAPGIVPLVESGKEDSEELLQYLKELLNPFRRKEDGGEGNPVDSVVLGCTHFPFVTGKIKEALGYEVTFYDGAYGTSRETKRRLKEAGLLTDSTEPGKIELYSTAEGDNPTALEKRLLELPFKYEP